MGGVLVAREGGMIKRPNVRKNVSPKILKGDLLKSLVLKS